MSKANETVLGKVLCKGSGLKAFLEIDLTKGEYGNKEKKRFRYELGTLQSITAQANRQVSHNHVAGRATAAGINKGLRNVYGNIVFQQIDAGILHSIFSDIKKWNSDKTSLTQADLDGYSFEDFTIAEDDAALLGSAKEDMEIKLYKSEMYDLTDLPPLDIVVLGSADDIDQTTGRYEVNNTYEFRAKGVTFLSETFGITAGAPLHNIATQVLILKGIQPWEKVEV